MSEVVTVLLVGKLGFQKQAFIISIVSSARLREVTFPMMGLSEYFKTAIGHMHVTMRVPVYRLVRQ